MTKLQSDYYTYAYLREDKTPYYIGKGRGKRIYCKNRTIKAPKDKSRILFLKKGLTEAEAFKHEVYMIFVLGRKDLGTGILRNRTNGGEGLSGAIRSEETRKKISVANSGENHPMYGVPRTEAQKKAQSERMISKNVGKTRTEAQKQAHSERMSGEKNPMYGVPRTEAQKKAQSERMSGEKHPLFGVPNSEVQKKAQSERMSGRYLGALHPSSKAIIAIEPDGTERHFGSGIEAARELGINPGALSGKYLKTGNSPTRGKFKGWKFIYQN